MVSKCCAASAQHSRTPVLMLTARGDTHDRIRGLEMGADDYLPKPFDPAELLARIRAILRRSAPQHTAPRRSRSAISKWMVERARFGAVARRWI